MKNIALAYRRRKMTPMHAEKLPLQPVLKLQMHERCGSILPQLARVDIMVDRRNVKKAR